MLDFKQKITIDASTIPWEWKLWRIDNLALQKKNLNPVKVKAKAIFYSGLIIKREDVTKQIIDKTKTNGNKTMIYV